MDSKQAYLDPDYAGGAPDSEVKNIDQLLPHAEGTQMEYTDQQKELIDKFREANKEFVLEIEGHYFHTDVYLTRFLAARNWDMEESSKLFREAMTWRKENNVANIAEICEKSPYFNMLTEYWPTSSLKGNNFFTFDNTPIAYDGLGAIDSNIVNIVPPKDLLNFHVYCIELLEKKFALQYKRYGHIKGAIMIMDLAGLSMDSLSLIDLLKQMTYIDENYYPCCLRKAVIVNAPGIFTVFWGLIKSFLDVTVQKKIEVFSDSKQTVEYFKQIIPPKFLLEEFGGECPYKLQSRGGSCKELGKSYPMVEGQIRKVVLGRSGNYDHKIEHAEDSKLLIKWEFTADDLVKFGIIYRKKHGEKEKEELVKVTKAKNCHKQKITGQFEAQSAGCYYVQFLNDAILSETVLSYNLSWEKV